MAVHRNSTVDRTDLQPLTLSELERHIERAAVERVARTRRLTTPTQNE